MTESEYSKCTAYGNSADILGKYLTKGKKLFIEGRLKTRKWNDVTGNPRQATEVIVDNFIFLDPRAESEEEGEVHLDHVDHGLAQMEAPASILIQEEDFAPAGNHPTF